MMPFEVMCVRMEYESKTFLVTHTLSLLIQYIYIYIYIYISIKLLFFAVLFRLLIIFWCFTAAISG